MYIQDIKWIDEEIKEAEVRISDGKYSVICFSQPFNGKVNQIYTENIICYDSEYLYAIDTEDYYVERIDYSFQYILKGKIINLNEKLLLVGELNIDLSNVCIPGDIKEGNFIEVKVTRLDLF